MGATPGKLALVGVLAVVLVAVVVGQWPDATRPPKLALRRPTPSSNQLNPQQAFLQKTIQEPSQRNDSSLSTNASGRSPEPQAWPELSLETIVAFDPFAEPQWLSAARTADQTGDPHGLLLSEEARRSHKAELLEKLRGQGTTIVVITSNEKRATIGKQSVRIGDHIEGFLITDITKQGVVLSEFEQQGKQDIH